MNCPSEEVLQAFLEGQLSDPEIGELEGHVLECQHCLQALAGMEAQGPLLQIVHSFQQKKPSQQDKPEVESLVARLCNLLSATRLGDSRSTPVGSETLPDATAPVGLPAVPAYEVLSFIDRGGMGEVYKARHLALDKIMALKLCTRERISPTRLGRFYQEMQAVGRLNHPHIVQAHDAGTTADGVPYLAMEYLEGIDLRELVKKNGPLPIAQACDYIRQAALGLEHAHEQGMVHRDLKPANLWLTSSGAVKILDLGLARLREQTSTPDADELDTTAPGRSITRAAMGTPEYMAPEQWRDAHEVDIRADLYSLGCTLYHLVTGRPPFEGDVLEQRRAHLEERPAPLRSRRADVPTALSNLVDRLLAKEPGERPATPAEVAAALEPFTGKATAKSGIGKRAWTWLLGSLAASLVCAGIIYVATDRGTVVIETDDADVVVAVTQNGRLIKLLDKKSGEEFTLRSGIYELAIQKGKEGLRLKSDRLELYRGDRKIVKVYLERPKGWVARTRMPFPTASAMVGVIDGRIYVVGGFNGEASLPSVQIYHPATDEWTSGTPMQRTDDGDIGRYSGSAVVFENRLHVLGGWRHFKDTAQRRHALPTSTHRIYDPAKDRKSADAPGAWSLDHSLPILSGASVAGVLNGRIHILTGADGNSGYHKHFQVYDEIKRAWIKLESPLHAHVGGTGGVVDGKFYVVGGQDDNGAIAAHLDTYDPATKRWTAGRPIPTERTTAAAVAVDGTLYVAGGQDKAGTVLDNVDAYDPRKEDWTSLPPLSAPRRDAVLAVVGKTLYVIGGSDAKGVIGGVESLDLASLARMAR